MPKHAMLKLIGTLRLLVLLLCEIAPAQAPSKLRPKDLMPNATASRTA